MEILFMIGRAAAKSIYSNSYLPHAGRIVQKANGLLQVENLLQPLAFFHHPDKLEFVKY